MSVTIRSDVAVAACPVSFETIDKPTARLGAIATAVLLAAYVATGAWPILAVVVADYVVRVLTRRRAPLSIVAAAVGRRLGVAPQPMDRAPKAFAWSVGFGLAVVSLALAPFAPAASLVVAGLLAGFSTLDGLGNVCVGCLLHQYVVVPRTRRAAGAR